MDVNCITPFIEAVKEVMPQLGFSNVIQKEIIEKSKKISVSGIALTVGIVGEKKGNVVYVLSINSAKKIASTMMMGMPVEEFNDMAQSAISELSNLLSANASINFSKQGINTDISVPALMYGENIEVSMNQEAFFSVSFDIDGINLDINVSLD